MPPPPRCAPTTTPPSQHPPPPFSSSPPLPPPPPSSLLDPSPVPDLPQHRRHLSKPLVDHHHHLPEPKFLFLCTPGSAKQRYYMARVHVRGTLPFPYLITQLGRRAEVPWDLTDEKPTAADCKKIIPHSRKFQALRYRPSFLTDSAKAATSSTAPSAPTAPATTTAPSPASEPIYHLVHRLFDRM
nr:leucine-rich repeat extensin-like protein 6 [Arachis hypogaea]